jgi:hypothetical protein
MILPSFLYLISPYFYIHYSSFLIFSLSEFAPVLIYKILAFYILCDRRRIVCANSPNAGDQTLVIRWQLKYSDGGASTPYKANL